MFGIPKPKVRSLFLSLAFFFPGFGFAQAGAWSPERLAQFCAMRRNTPSNLVELGRAASALTNRYCQSVAFGQASPPNNPTERVSLANYQCTGTPEQCLEKARDISMRLQIQHMQNLKPSRVLEHSMALNSLVVFQGGPTRDVIINIQGFGREQTSRTPYVTGAIVANQVLVTLPGHGDDRGALGSVRAEDWIAEVNGAVRLARDIGGRTTIIADSLGGALAVRAAIENPNLVENLFLIQPALKPQEYLIAPACAVSALPRALGVSIFPSVESGCEVDRVIREPSEGAGHSRAAYYQGLRARTVILRTPNDMIVRNSAMDLLRNSAPQVTALENPFPGGHREQGENFQRRSDLSNYIATWLEQSFGLTSGATMARHRPRLAPPAEFATRAPAEIASEADLFRAIAYFQALQTTDQQFRTNCCMANALYSSVSFDHRAHCPQLPQNSASREFPALAKLSVCVGLLDAIAESRALMPVLQSMEKNYPSICMSGSAPETLRKVRHELQVLPAYIRSLPEYLLVPYRQSGSRVLPRTSP